MQRNKAEISMTAIIDYDAGNIKSVEKAVSFLGHEAVVTRDEEVIMNSDRVILPGVGSFGDAMGRLKSYGLDKVLCKYAKSGKPFLGICLGLQLLFEDSEESPGVEGLGILKGHVLRIPKKDGLTVPQIGWNDLSIRPGTKLFEGVKNGAFVYFVHSYYLSCEEADAVAATTEYGVTVHAAVEKGNVFACQFHPEKSSDVGLKILDNFLKV